MAKCLTAEYRAIANNTDKVINVMSLDTTNVAAKLITKEIIPLSSLEEKPSQLAMKIGSSVSTDPKKFEATLDALNEIPTAKDLAGLLHEEHQKIKAKELETTKVQKLHSPQSTETNNQDPLSPKFPYLNTKDLSENERERLIARLEVDSGKMQDKFAILVDRVRESLEKKNILCSDLSVLVRHSQKNRLLRLIKKKKNIRDLFLKLGDYWTFFDYDFLSIITERHCPELKSELSDYVSSFKEYCKRRICEVPSDVYVKRGIDEHKLCIKCDCNFNTTTLEDIKILECKLSRLLGTELYLLSVEKGCIKLEFKSMCPISTPLTHEQTEELKELRIIHLYDSFGMSIYFDNHFAYDDDRSSHNLFPHYCKRHSGVARTSLRDNIQTSSAATIAHCDSRIPGVARTSLGASSVATIARCDIRACSETALMGRVQITHSDSMIQACSDFSRTTRVQIWNSTQYPRSTCAIQHLKKNCVSRNCKDNEVLAARNVSRWFVEIVDSFKRACEGFEASILKIKEISIQRVFEHIEVSILNQMEINRISLINQSINWDSFFKEHNEIVNRKRGKLTQEEVTVWRSSHQDEDTYQRESTRVGWKRIKLAQEAHTLPHQDEDTYPKRDIEKLDRKRPKLAKEDSQTDTPPHQPHQDEDACLREASQTSNMSENIWRSKSPVHTLLDDEKGSAEKRLPKE